MNKISIFKNCKALKPFATLSLAEIVKNTRQGTWKKEIETLRGAKNEKRQESLKKSLPALTICGESNGRDIVKPSGYIGIDVDSKHHKENIVEKFSTLCNDPYIHAAWISSRGLGLRLVFKINPAKHEDSFRGIEKYLYEKYSLRVDLDCKDVKRLSFVSYHEGAYIGHNKKVFRKLVKAPKIPSSPSDTVISYEEISSRVKAIVKSKKDITDGYHNWVAIGLLFAEVGDKGRELFQSVSKFHPQYDKASTDLQFNNCLKSVQRKGKETKEKVTTATLDYLMRQNNVIKLNGKMKLNLSNGQEDKTTQTIYASDMLLESEAERIYSYGLLEFRVIKKDKFKCTGMRSERVGEWLQKNGYKVFGTVYYHIENNIVREVHIKKIQNDLYVKGVVEKIKGLQFMFDANGDAIPKDMALDAAGKNCKKILDTITFNTDFDPNDDTKFLKDTRTEMYLKYSDTVVKVIGKSHTKIPYKEIPGLVWEKSKLPYKFTTSEKKSSVQLILDKCIGEENRDAYMTAVGFMISSFLPPEENLMLFCIDLNTKGVNNGRNGKDFIRQILEQVRSVARIPGENFDPKREFATAWADRDSEIIWFEDLKEGTKMRAFYNFSNGVPIRRLNTQPFYVKAKVGVSLQYAIDIEGSSNKQRQLFLLFKNYFSKLPKGIFSEFGSIFATDWPDTERAKFNSFIIQCCQKFLTLGVKQMPIDELIEARKEKIQSSMFECLEIGKHYTLSEAIEYLQRQGYELRTTDPQYFKKDWYAYCDLAGKFLDDTYRTAKARYYTMLNSEPPRMKITKRGKTVE